MFESIRAIIMERQSVMREICLKWKGDICPSIQNRLEWVKDQQRFWKPCHAGGDHWEVRQLNESFKVNLGERKCSCRMWELSGIPCPHGCVVILKIGRNPEEFVPGWFRKGKYLDVYSCHIMPVGGMSTWPENKHDKPLPPLARRMPGRPKKKRRRAAHEGPISYKTRAGITGQRISRQRLVMTCSICGEKGHNKGKCTREGLEEPIKVKNKGGRPRKQQNVGENADQGGGAGPSRGQASVSMNGQPVVQASVEVRGNSRGRARVNVGGQEGCEATVNLSGGDKTPIQGAQSVGKTHQNPQVSVDGHLTPITTQESQTDARTPPRFKPKWTKCKILLDKSPEKATSAGPSRRYEDNVVMGSHSVLTKASAALGVTSMGFGKAKTRGPHKVPLWWGAGVCIDPLTNETFIGGPDGIHIPVWPKDVPIPSATEELAKKKKAMEALREKAAEEGKKRAVEAVRRMMGYDKALNDGNNIPSEAKQPKIARLATHGKAASQPKPTAKTSQPSQANTSQGKPSAKNCEPSVASECVIRKVGGANNLVRSQPSPVRVRPPSERILNKKLARKIEGLGTTLDSAVSVE